MQSNQTDFISRATARLEAGAALMHNRYVRSLDRLFMIQKCGRKAENLSFLLRNGFPVPSGWVVTWDAFTDFQLHGSRILDVLHHELEAVISPVQTYAVRSSASVEDDGRCSFAGQFRSFLDIQGLPAILESIQAVWRSADSAEFRAYHQQHAVSVESVQMAVIIQEMVRARASGVAFSKNPLTGLSETILEAGAGNGEEQQAARQDPERWVSKWGSWLEKTNQGLISDSLALDIVSQTGRIAKKFGKPVDVEWAYDGQSLHFLQVRPITRLDIPVYSNRIAREMLPGLIKPLVWSVNTRLINQTWVGILTRLTGDRSFDPDSLTGHFYYRAYFNMSVFGRVFERLGMPAEALELLFGLEREGPEKPHMRPGMGILLRMPRLTGFLFSLLRMEHRLEPLLSRKMAEYKSLESRMTQEHTPREWLDLAEQIHEVTRPVAYFNIMIPMLGMMVHRVLTGQLRKLGHDARDVALAGVEAALDQYSPHRHLQRLQRKYGRLDADRSPDSDAALEADLTRFMERFGHFSDSGNDCSSIPWRETPDLIRQMILRPLQEQKTDRPSVAFEDLRIPLSNRGVIRHIYHWASRFAVYREAISSLYTYGYGQYRRCFVGLGDALVCRGVLAHHEDVFYLYRHELINLVDQEDWSSRTGLVSERKTAIGQVRDAVVPETIFGQEQPPVGSAIGRALRGVATSLGHYTGPARILQGLSETDRLQSGDVLVIPYSDVGWTPLFARAGAVVAESGGILSHSSIVAREYRIPAVVSVPGACRIPDGARVTVNGFSGEVLIEEVAG